MAIEELREREAKLRTLTETAPDGILSLDARGRLVYLNPAAGRMFGLDAGRATGKPVSALIPARFQRSECRGAKRFEPVWQACSNVPTGDLAGVRRDGTEFPLECSVSAARVEGQLLFTAIVRDRTEQKRAEVVASVFVNLGQSLSRASSPRDVAVAVLEAADHLCHWDSSYMDLLDERREYPVNIISYDVVDAKRQVVPGAKSGKLGPLARKALAEGPQLVLRNEDYTANSAFLYGNRSLPSLSIMISPVRCGGSNVGMLSVQSYAPHAYRDEDLRLFAALADFCSGALERTAAEQQLRQSQQALRQESAYVGLLAKVGSAANESSRLPELIHLCLEEICALTGWELGNALFVQGWPEAPALSLSGQWYASRPEFLDTWKKAVDVLDPAELLHLRSSVLKGELAWKTCSGPAEQALGPGKGGFQSAFGLPVRVGGEVVCALEFYSTSAAQPSSRLLEVLKAVGDQLSRVVERSRAEQRLAHGALHDALTDLPNRSYLEERLQHSLALAKRNPGYSFGVLFLDLDRFKVINDSLGHQVGDEFLITVARKLQECVRGTDMVARLGGDEFAILIEEIADVTDCTRVADRISDILSQPLLVGEHSLVVSTSIGIVIGPGRSDAVPSDLLRDADAAMYKAKANGKACYQLFDPEMHARALLRLELEGELREALDKGHIVPWLQPVVSMTSGQIIGFEALARWLHPDRGVISPADFIPIAEETGLINDLGWQVAHQACLWMQQTHPEVPGHPSLSVSVNVSAVQLHRTDFLDRLRQLLFDTGISPRQLRLEITESSLLGNDRSLLRLFDEVRAMEVQIQVDDFGTGYSSLSYLHCFPVDALKMDRSFVRNLGKEEMGVELVRAIIALAQSLRMNVIAEGVETEEQLRQLVGLGCDLAQGFFFSPPVSCAKSADLGPAFPTPLRADRVPEDAAFHPPPESLRPN